MPDKTQSYPDCDHITKITAILPYSTSRMTYIVVGWALNSTRSLPIPLKPKYVSGWVNGKFNAPPDKV